MNERINDKRRFEYHICKLQFCARKLTGDIDCVFIREGRDFNSHKILIHGRKGKLSILIKAADELSIPSSLSMNGFAPIFPDTCYHLTHYWPAAADIPVASDNPVHYADAIRYNARTPLQGSLLPLTRLV